MIRRTLTFPPGLDTRIRKIQAQLLINEDRDITFTQVVVQLLHEALDHREVDMSERVMDLCQCGHWYHPNGGYCGSCGCVAYRPTKEKTENA